MIFSRAYAAHVQPTTKNYPRFIELIQLAKGFEVGAPTREQFDFWHGYSLYQHGMALQPTPETVASANRTLPMFNEALVLFEQGKGYADRTSGIEYQVYVENTGVYIEIQEAVIERANRR
jgi:hypothetical protein